MKLILRLRRYQSHTEDIRVVLRGLDGYKFKEFLGENEEGCLCPRCCLCCRCCHGVGVTESLQLDNRLAPIYRSEADNLTTSVRQTIE